MPTIISNDSTIQSVWPHLTHQRAYVTGVLQKMRQCNSPHGTSSVKIGVTGTGQKPYYRVSYPGPHGDIIFGSFYDNHDPLENGFAATYNWSTKSMTFDELLNWYADTIGFMGKRA